LNLPVSALQLRKHYILPIDITGVQGRKFRRKFSREIREFSIVSKSETFSHQKIVPKNETKIVPKNETFGGINMSGYWRKWLAYRRSSDKRYLISLKSHILGAAGITLLLVNYFPNVFVRYALILGLVGLGISVIEHLITCAMVSKQKGR